MLFLLHCFLPFFISFFLEQLFLSLHFKWSLELWIEIIKILQISWESCSISIWLWNKIIFNLFLFFNWFWHFNLFTFVLSIFNSLNSLSHCHLFWNLGYTFWLSIKWFGFFFTLIVTSMWSLFGILVVIVWFIILFFTLFSCSLYCSFLSFFNIIHCCYSFLLFFG